METVNIGIVGFGGRGGHVGYTAETVTGGLMKTVAVVEPSTERYEKACVDYRCNPKRYNTPREMVSKEKIDVVIIGSPNEYHLENLMEMEGLKIPVFIEKPLDSTWEKINELVRFTKRYAAPVMVGHCMRYAPIIQKSKELIKQGAIGRICSARFVQNCHYGNIMFHGWRRERKRAGTQMIEKATHDIDVMQWLLEAKPVSVFASSKRMVFGGDKRPELHCRNCHERLTCPESMTNIMHRWTNSFEEMKNMDDLCVFSSVVDTPDDEICLIQFDNGIHGTYTHAFYTPRSFHHRDYQIIGNLGAIDIDLGDEFGGKILVAERYGTHADKAVHNFDYLMRNHYNGDGFMTQHLYEVASGKAKPQTTIEQAYLAEAVGYAAIQSAEKEAVVYLKDIIPDDLSDILKKNIF